MIRDVDANDDDIITGLRESLRVGRDTVEKASAGVSAVLSNEMQTKAARFKAARELAHRHYQTGAKAFDSAVANAKSELDKIERATRAPQAPTDASTRMTHSEVRQVLARMSRDDRAKAIAAALKGDDPDSELVAAAVLGGAAILSGMSAAELELEREGWRQRHFPHDLQRAKRIRAALTHVDRGASLFRGFLLGELLPGTPDEIARAEASEAAADAAIAAAA
jgi:hypothetical protein